MNEINVKKKDLERVCSLLVDYYNATAENGELTESSADEVLNALKSVGYDGEITETYNYTIGVSFNKIM